MQLTTKGRAMPRKTSASAADRAVDRAARSIVDEYKRGRGEAVKTASPKKSTGRPKKSRGKKSATKAPKKSAPTKKKSGVTITEAPFVAPEGSRRMTEGEFRDLVRRGPREWSTDAKDADEWATCRTCGGMVIKANRHHYSTPWATHLGCRALNTPARRARAAVEELIGDVLTEDDARLVAGQVGVTSYADQPDSEPTRVKGRLPRAWGHVDDKRLRRAVQNLDALRSDAGLTAMPCDLGACAWCGTAEATGWSSHGHQWPDGSRAPLCGRCSKVYERRGSPTPTFWDADQRAAISEAMCGVPVMLGEQVPGTISAYAESGLGRDGGEAWHHLNPEAVERYRWSQWGRWRGKYAPAEHKAEAVRRAQEIEVEQARRAREQAEAEQARQDVYGFAGGRGE